MPEEQDAFAPRRTAKPPEELSLTGKLIPYKECQPCYLNMPLSHHAYLPCFDGEDELRAMMASAKIDFDNIKHIDDGRDFLVSIPAHIIVITNMRWTERGTIKFLQVFRD